MTIEFLAQVLSIIPGTMFWRGCIDSLEVRGRLISARNRFSSMITTTDCIYIFVHVRDIVTLQEEKIEDIVDNGQLEELILDGKRELELIEKYSEWRLWEAVEELDREKSEVGAQKEG